MEFKTFLNKYQRIYRNVIKTAKAYDIDKILEESANLWKTTWKIINNKRKPMKLSNNWIKTEDKHFRDPQEMANAYNVYFSQVAFKEIQNLN